MLRLSLQRMPPYLPPPFLACIQELAVSDTTVYILFTDKASFFLASFPSLPAAFLPSFLACIQELAVSDTTVYILFTDKASFFLASFPSLPAAFLPSFLALLPLLSLLKGSMLISFLMPIIFFWCVSPSKVITKAVSCIWWPALLYTNMASGHAYGFFCIVMSCMYSKRKHAAKSI